MNPRRITSYVIDGLVILYAIAHIQAIVYMVNVLAQHELAINYKNWMLLGQVLVEEFPLYRIFGVLSFLVILMDAFKNEFISWVFGD